MQTGAKARLRIRAITFDLDDTLWPIAPTMLRAEESLDAWLKTHCPRSAQAFSIAAMRRLRERVADENPQLAHDFSAQRRLSLRSALLPHGYDDSHVDGAFAAFYAARNEVQCYADTQSALTRLAARYPLAAISNGNADLGIIGLGEFFRFSLHAAEFGRAKPDAEIFHAACTRLDLEPAEVLHVGDDPMLDVAGAHRAGLRCAWLNRNASRWPPMPASSGATVSAKFDCAKVTPDLIVPDLIVHDLDELIALLDADEN